MQGIRWLTVLIGLQCGVAVATVVSFMTGGFVWAQSYRLLCSNALEPYLSMYHFVFIHCNIL